MNDEKNMRVFPIIEDAEKAYENAKQKNFTFEELDYSRLASLSVGNLIEQDELSQLRQSIIKTANDYRYGEPGIMSSTAHTTELDKKIGLVIYHKMNITASIAATLSMWQFLNIQLIPDFLFWRWGDSKDHFLSPRRNYLGTQWWRHYLFAKSNENRCIFDTMTDKDIADLYERTNSRGYPDHVVNIAQWFHENNSSFGTVNSSLLFREVIKSYNAELGYKLYFALSEEDRHALFNKCFHIVLNKLKQG